MSKSHLIGICLCLLAAGCTNGNKRVSELVVCGDDKVLIIDEQASEEENVSVVWRWEVADAADQLPETYQKYLIPFDECKSVDNHSKLLLTSSGGGVVLLERATKKCLFYAYAPMAHSADLLPDGKIAVALSTHPKGNSIEVYDIHRPEQVLFRDSLYSGHGAVWIAERNRFYALGYDELREYSLKDWDSPAPRLALEKKWPIPVEGGHDLSLVSGNELLVSGHEGVYLFNIQNEQFTPFDLLQSTHDVKSVNYDSQTAKLVYTKAEESWWTYHVYFKNPDKKLTIPDIKLYKVRTINY